VKRKRFSLQLNEQQQLILGVVLVILLAISMLYCLGLASLILRDAWENIPMPAEDATPFEEELDQPVPTVEPSGDGIVPPEACTLQPRAARADTVVQGNCAAAFDRTMLQSYNRSAEGHPTPQRGGTLLWTLSHC
jgi:hypothetical protein